MSDTVKVENLRIKIGEGNILELTPEKAVKLRDALLELFPSTPSQALQPIIISQAVPPIIIEKHIHDWPYYHWTPYYWGNTTSGEAYESAGSISSGTLMCNLEG